MGIINDRFRARNMARAATAREAILPEIQAMLAARKGKSAAPVAAISGEVVRKLNAEREAKRAALKGVYLGNCNITACQQPGAVWWNRGSRAYYCRECARDINRWPAWDGQPLCVDRGIMMHPLDRHLYQLVDSYAELG